jgi:hypothetical protein
MGVRYILALTTVLSAVCLAQGSRPRSYTEASAVWERAKDGSAYQTYASEFAQYNNSLRLDERDGCYALSADPVDVMLIITRPQAGEYAVVEDVLARVDSPKARCFQRSHRGIPTKIPPFVPFVLQMSFG